MRHAARVTMSMRELDRLKCIQAVVDEELYPDIAAKRILRESQTSASASFVFSRQRRRFHRIGANESSGKGRAYLMIDSKTTWPSMAPRNAWLMPY
jgi:hypothetical protein